MRFSLVVLIFISIFSTFSYGQESLRRQKFAEVKSITQQLKLLKEENKRATQQQLEIIAQLQSVSDEDLSEAEKVGAKAVRLYPCCELKDLIKSMDGLNYLDTKDYDVPNLRYPFRFSSILVTDFSEKRDKNVTEFSDTFTYKDDSLIITKSRNNDHAFIADLGVMPFENINEDTREVVALAEYKPPANENDINPEFTSGNIVFGQNVSVNAGKSYILRAVRYKNSFSPIDDIFALKIHRKDENGSIILFIKTIESFEPTKLSDPEREEFARLFNLGLVTKLKEELNAKGLKDVQVEVSDKTFILKGFVPRGRINEAIKIADGIYQGMKVESELVESYP